MTKLQKAYCAKLADSLRRVAQAAVTNSCDCHSCDQPNRHAKSCYVSGLAPDLRRVRLHAKDLETLSKS